MYRCINNALVFTEEYVLFTLLFTDCNDTKSTKDIILIFVIFCQEHHNEG